MSPTVTAAAGFRRQASAAVEHARAAEAQLSATRKAVASGRLPAFFLPIAEATAADALAATYTAEAR